MSIALVSDTGSSATDKITSNPAIKGTGQASTVVTIKEGSTILGTPTADSTGAWSFTPTGLLDGAHTLSAFQTDLAGNTGTATLSFTLDKTPPALSIGLVSDTGSSATDKITSNPAIKGTGEASTVVTIKEGSTTLGTVTADSTGVWSYTPTGFVDGVHTLTAFQTDLAGNTGTATLSFTLYSPATALYGTQGNDVLTGTIIGHNVIYGLGGNDTISVSYSSATTELYGGDGDDIITGSLWGADYIDGGPGNDNLSGNWGNDIILGGDGNDRIDGGAGDDVLYTGSGNDYVQGRIWQRHDLLRTGHQPDRWRPRHGHRRFRRQLRRLWSEFRQWRDHGCRHRRHVEPHQHRNDQVQRWILRCSFQAVRLQHSRARGHASRLVSDTGSSPSDRITSNPAIKGTGQAEHGGDDQGGQHHLGTTTADSTGAWSYHADRPSRWRAHIVRYPDRPGRQHRHGDAELHARQDSAVL